MPTQRRSTAWHEGRQPQLSSCYYGLAPAIFPSVIKSRADGRAQGHLKGSELLLAKFKLPIGSDQQPRGLRICSTSSRTAGSARRRSSEWQSVWLAGCWLPGYGSKLGPTT